MINSGKTRVVSFRLSESEYQHLVAICTAKGTRTLSEIARLIVCSLIEDSDSDAPEALATRVSRLDRDVLALNAEIRKLAATIQSALLEPAGNGTSEDREVCPEGEHGV